MVKRYPFFGISIPISTHFSHYYMPDILTRQTLLTFTLKIISCVSPRHKKYPIIIQNIKSKSKSNYLFTIQYPQQLAGVMGLTSGQLLTQYFLNPIYCTLIFKLNSNLKSNQIMVGHPSSPQKEHRVTSVQDLNSLLLSYAIEGINEFSQSIFTTLN